MLRRFARRLKTLGTFHVRAREIQRAMGRSPYVQLIEWLRLRRAIGMSDREYFLYELYREDVSFEDKLQYFTSVLHVNHQGPLLPPAYVALLDDKYVFKQYYASLHFPMPAAYGIYHPFHGRATTGTPLRRPEELKDLLSAVRGPGLVIKHAMSGSGRSVLVFESVTGGSEPHLVHVNGSHYSFNKLIAHVTPSDPLAHPGFLIEERVQQHSFLERLNPKTLHTTRVVTIMADDGSIHVIGATLKIGFDESGVESSVEDNLSAAVDLETGRLGPVVQRQGLAFRRMAYHPVHQIVIEGETLPFWPDIKQLAIEAARAARCIRSVGWDIGLSLSGPVLIEGNQAWGAEILQIPLGRGIWTPAFRALIETPPSVSASRKEVARNLVDLERSDSANGRG